MFGWKCADCQCGMRFVRSADNKPRVLLKAQKLQTFAQVWETGVRTGAQGKRHTLRVRNTLHHFQPPMADPTPAQIGQHYGSIYLHML